MTEPAIAFPEPATEVRPASSGVEPRPSGAALLGVTGRQILVAVRFLVGMTILTGIIYPLVLLGIGSVLAGHSAAGSLLTDAQGRVVGSSLIGQQFRGNEWFLPRPSAAGAGYDAMASGGSNLSADSPVLQHSVEERRAAIAHQDGVDPSQVPPDAVTASGSGLDPDISPQYARIQVNRVAASRGLPIAQVVALVEAHVQSPALGFLGEPRVNVLELNLALSELHS